MSKDKKIITIEKINEQTKKANKEFAKMSKAQKKVAIAKDVIKSLNTNKFKATPGNYLEFKKHKNLQILPEDKADGPIELQALVQSKFIQCGVCAIGGIFAAKANLGNKCEININNSWGSEHIESIDSDDMVLNLKGIFTKEELRAIEYAFEGKDIDGAFNSDYYPKYKNFPHAKYKAFKRKYGKAKDRMIAIMENIIKNEGEFKI